MRRVTWMVKLHQMDKRLGAGAGFYKISWVPMQRTRYYMPWGTVTVDELSKMGYPESIHCRIESDSGWAIASRVNDWD